MHHALQCGFCTPGMITTAHALSPRSRTATPTACARCCRATSAAAPATSGSSRRCSTRAPPTRSPARMKNTFIGSAGGAPRGPALSARPRRIRRRLRLPGLLYAVILRSSVAHGRIVSIDASAALKMPGVHAVITGAGHAGRPADHSDAAATAAGVQAVRAAGDRPRQGALCRRADGGGAGRQRRDRRGRAGGDRGRDRGLAAGGRLADRAEEQKPAVRGARHQPLADVPGRARATPTRLSPLRPTSAARTCAPAATTG